MGEQRREHETSRRNLYHGGFRVPLAIISAVADTAVGSMDYAKIPNFLQNNLGGDHIRFGNSRRSGALVSRRYRAEQLAATEKCTVYIT